MRTVPLVTVVLLSLFAISFEIALYINHTRKKQPPVSTHTLNRQNITDLIVFIHGTVGSSLSLCNPFDCLTQSARLQEPDADEKAQPKLSERVVQGYRNHPNMRYDQLLNAEGITYWNPAESTAKEAATYLIPIYKKIAKLSNTSGNNEIYALFGWSGLLTQAARKAAGFALYEELINFQQQQIVSGYTPGKIRLVTHSHGGNVALWLAEAEKIHKKGLQIESLVMFGAPIQVETAPFIRDPMFQTIYLCYSLADSVQRSDCISTRSHKSFARMQDLVDLEEICKKNPSLHRYDILMAINKKEEPITHINMWLCGRSNKLAPALGSLPLMVVTPLLFTIPQAEDPIPTQLQLSIDIQQGAIGYSLYRRTHMKKLHTTTTWYESDKILEHTEHAKKLYKTVAYWANRMEDEWRIFDTSRNIFWNKKNLDIITSYLWPSQS